MIVRKSIVACFLLCFVMPAHAGNVSGKVVRVEGRMNNECAYVFVKRTSDGAIFSLRVLAGTASNSIISTALTALTTQLSVDVQFSATSSCGGDQAIDIIGVVVP